MIYDFEEVRPPYDWCARLGIAMGDIDGWRNDGKSWDDPLTLREFIKRLSVSTFSTRPESAWYSSISWDSYYKELKQ